MAEKEERCYRGIAKKCAESEARMKFLKKLMVRKVGIMDIEVMLGKEDSKLKGRNSKLKKKKK